MVLLAAVALLQTGQGFFTIEARVGEATGVYRGRMVSALGNGEGDYAPVRFGIQVEETLKGPTRRKIEFPSSDSVYQYNLSVYRAWIAKGTDFLFFFTPPKKGDGGPSWRWLRLGAKIPEESIYANRDDEGVPTMDLVATNDMTGILARAREFARKHPAPLPWIKLDIPFSVARRMGTTGDYNVLLLPSSPELEPLARRFVEAPETFIGAMAVSGESPDVMERRRQGEIAQVRASGIRTLVGFKSARNIALLKKCLGDPSFTHVIGPGERSRKVYDVRRAAFEVLQAWKVSALVSPLEEPWPTTP